MKLNDVSIDRIDEKFAEELSALLINGDKKYTQYFIPFEYDVDTIKSKLSRAKIDRYFGIFIDSKLVGFYMLRGWDAGYEIPSYGVWVSEKYSGKGLGKLTLSHAITFCKVNNVKRLMLKVHPDNLGAKIMYEKTGFKQTGFDEKINNLIYHLEF